jgi:hypothetical protein
MFVDQLAVDKRIELGDGDANRIEQQGQDHAAAIGGEIAEEPPQRLLLWLRGSIFAVKGDRANQFLQH